MAAASEPLNSLLAAPSREALDAFLAACFRLRGNLDELVTSRAVVSLGLDPEQARATARSAVGVVSAALYNSADITSAEAVAPCIPAGVDHRLGELLCALVFAALPAWREAAIEGRPSLPRLERLDWRVDVVAGSSEATAAVGGVPVVLLDCLVRDPPARTDALPSSRHVAVELDATALGALLDGMRRIKDQLAAAVQ